MRNFFCLLFLIPIISIAQNTDSAWIVQNYIKKEVYIPMRDGVKLFTSVYIPKDVSEKHPILMTRTPYSCAPYGENEFRKFWRNHYKTYLKENFIMVIQDVRGRWMSEGEFLNIRPYLPNKKNKTDIDEASDTYDTIDWLVHNINNNNGNIGVFGISYPGFYTAMAALSNHPALKAVSPQAPVTDWFMGDDFHHNGAFFAMDAFAFYSSFGKPRPKPTTVGPTAFNYPIKDNYRFYLTTGALPNLTRLLGDSIAFWNNLMNHPNYNAWWQERNDRNFMQHILPGTASLVVGGLFDAEDCFGAWNLYKAIESNAKNNNKLVIGPWYHGQWASGNGTHLGNIYFNSNTADWYAQHIEIPYFNYYLKGIGTVDSIAEANIFFSGANEWHRFNAWPPDNTQPQPVYLEKNGVLSFLSKKEKAISYDEYISDPARPVPYTAGIHEYRTREYMDDDQRFAATRPDVLVYETPPLEEDITLAGPLMAHLKVSISTTDADFVVKLIDAFPEDFSYTTHQTYPMGGYEMLVRGEIMRGRYRNSFEKPEAFIPNVPTIVQYTMPDVAHTFKKGHKIMIQVQSSWFPLADRNPQQFIDIYHAKNSDFKKATIRVFHHDSYVQLPILPNFK